MKGYYRLVLKCLKPTLGNIKSSQAFYLLLYFCGFSYCWVPIEALLCVSCLARAIERV